MADVLQARQFLFLAEELAMQRLPEPQRPPERNVMWTILQLHYGDPRLHFELQPRPARNDIELGLHFESSAELNEARALVIANGRGRIESTLGEPWELEEWTASWRRLHRTFRAESLTRTLAAEVAAEFAALITCTGDLARRMTLGDLTGE